MIHFPGFTDDGAILTLHKFTTNDASKWEVAETFKYDIMAIDIFQSIDQEIAEYEVGIIDGADVSLKHLWKLMGSLWHIKVFLEFVQDAVPYYLKEVHVINVSSIVKHAYNFIKPFVSTKTLIVFHDSHETLLERFNEKQLPKEYGGSGGTFDEMQKTYHKKLEKNVENLKLYNFS